MAIRVLIVDDSAADYTIISRELRRALPQIQTAIVSTREAFVDALANPPDAILLDYDLGMMTGDEALGILRERAPSIPAIVVSGTVGEEKVADAFKRGAVDFVSKDRRERLPKAVENAIKLAAKVRETAALEAQAMRDQRLEILGSLSAGIVHDLNGILQCFILGIPLLREHATDEDAKILDQMDSASKRGADLTAQILTFARGSNGTAFKAVAVPYLLGEMRSMMKATFPPNVHVKVKTEIGTTAVLGDATQLLQVLQNLCINGHHAMLPKGGELTLHAQNVSSASGMPGPCVQISVTDTGTGIPEEVLPLIFNPFFSTKPPGEGSGLGLPTVKRIVEAHHGILTVKTEAGKGTTFSVFLPIATMNGGIVAQEEAGRGGGKTVVVVDDDSTLREFTRLHLESAGYKVLTASHGVEALSFFAAGGPIHALVTDNNMPVMGGVALIEKLRADSIDIPVMLLSGYDSAEAKQIEVSSLLRKPVSREKLLSELKRILA